MGKERPLIAAFVVILGMAGCDLPGGSEPDYEQQAIGGGYQLCFSFPSHELAQRFGVRPGHGFPRRLSKKLYLGQSERDDQVRAAFVQGCRDGVRERGQKGQKPAGSSARH